MMELENNEILGGKVKKDNQTSQEWARPNLPAINQETDSIIFQQIEIDHYIAEFSQLSIFRMYGVTMEGNSVCAHVHGFAHYLYVQAPENFEKHHLKGFKSILNQSITKYNKFSRENVEDSILAVEIVAKQLIHCYVGEDKMKFIKITVSFI